MAKIYWRQRVSLTVGELSYADAIAFNKEVMNSGKERLNFEATDLETQAARLLSSVLVKYATKAIETRDAPDGKWKPLKLGDSRVVEVAEGELVTLTFSTDLQATMDMLDALPVTLASVWVKAAEEANEGIGNVPFLAWWNPPMPSQIDGESKSDSLPSSEPQPRRRKTKTTGQENTTPQSSPNTLPSSEG